MQKRITTTEAKRLIARLDLMNAQMDYILTSLKQRDVANWVESVLKQRAEYEAYVRSQQSAKSAPAAPAGTKIINLTKGGRK